LLAALGCSAEGSDTGAGKSEEATGSIALRLSANDASGETYRLRNASFTINGYSYATGNYVPTNLTVSSETDPSVPVINTQLLEGPYSVSFFDNGWYIEHLTSAGAEVVAKVAFLGPANQSAFVQRGVSTPVSFNFGVNGDILDFYGGNLEIGITVQQATGGISGTGGSTGTGGVIEGGAGGAF
jgi:hypothetical protein